MSQRQIPQLSLKHIQRPGKAFTLVEVAIALGIFAFVFIALVGLLSAGLDFERAAHKDTVMGNIVSYVVTDLHSSKYTIVTGETLANPQTSFSRWYQFDSDGVWTSSGTGAPAADSSAMYLCTASGTLASSPKRMQVTGSVEFPLVAKPENRKKEIFVTTITPYGATKQ